VDLIPIAHVPFENRYTVTKVKSMDGFYAATYNIGFRDDFDVKVRFLCFLTMVLANIFDLG